MKRMKKILAMVMAMAMVLGMSLTAFAAGTATITVNNAEKATLTMKQIIAPNQETETGWAFVNGAGGYYQRAFDNTNEQEIIWSLIKYQTPNAANIPADITVATADQIQNALKLVEQYIAYDEFTNGDSVS